MTDYTFERWLGDSIADGACVSDMLAGMTPMRAAECAWQAAINGHIHALRERTEKAEAEVERLKRATAEEIQRLNAENAKLLELLEQARTIVERAATIKMNDGTYFDKDCACTLLLAALGEKP
jgi:hypothetical protein